MVALGRALMIGTRSVLWDEPFQGLVLGLGLAVAHRYADVLRQVRSRRSGTTMVITESNSERLQNFGNIVLSIERGVMTHQEGGLSAH